MIYYYALAPTQYLSPRTHLLQDRPCTCSPGSCPLGLLTHSLTLLPPGIDLYHRTWLLIPFCFPYHFAHVILGHQASLWGLETQVPSLILLFPVLCLLHNRLLITKDSAQIPQNQASMCCGSKAPLVAMWILIKMPPTPAACDLVSVDPVRPLLQIILL